MTVPQSFRAVRQRFYRRFALAHSQLLFRTRGRPERLGWRLHCLVLETTGRRSGQPRRVVLLYMPDDEGFVVVASNFGNERPPAWWVNLEATPDAVVEHRGRRFAVRARELQGDERTATLARAVAYNKQWRGYAATVRRPLPVVRLEPA
jgi:F420H(2)-dependent quinone reductase